MIALATWLSDGRSNGDVVGTDYSALASYEPDRVYRVKQTPSQSNMHFEITGLSWDIPDGTNVTRLHLDCEHYAGAVLDIPSFRSLLMGLSVDIPTTTDGEVGTMGAEDQNVKGNSYQIGPNYTLEMDGDIPVISGENEDGEGVSRPLTSFHTVSMPYSDMPTNSDGYKTIPKGEVSVFRYDGTGTGNIMRKRIIMMVGQVQLKDDSLVPETVGVHLLDDDANWQIFEREMKIKAGKFFANCGIGNGFPPSGGDRVEGWGSVINEMEQVFYRTKFYHYNDGSIVYRPERVLFPDFARFRHEYSLQQLGLSGGADELSADTSIESMVIHVGSSRRPFNFTPGTHTFSYNVDVDVAEITLTVTPTNRFARAEVPTLQYVGVDADLIFKVIAEDDREQEYTLNIVPS